MGSDLADRLFAGIVALIGRRSAWRIGRRLYVTARGEPVNDMDSNGEVDLMRAALRVAGGEPILVWDVGGNLGIWTDRLLACAGNAKRAVRVDIFEPAPSTFARLQAHFAGNEAVTTHCLALSNRRGTAKFELVGPEAGTNSLNLSGISGNELIDVAVDTAAQVVAQSGAAPDFVKIDAEGHDLDVMRGMEPLLAAGAVGIVQFEYNWRWLISGASLRGVFGLADRHGYRLGRMLAGEIEFFDSWNAELDRFIEANYILSRPDLAARLPHRVTGWDYSNLPVVLPSLK